MLLHGGVERQAIGRVHCRVWHRAYDEGRPNHVPLNSRLARVLEQSVFLNVVEVFLVDNSLVGLNCRKCKTAAVVFSPGL